MTLTSEECLKLLELLEEGYSGPPPGLPLELWIFPSEQLREQIASLKQRIQGASHAESPQAEIGLDRTCIPYSSEAMLQQA